MGGTREERAAPCILVAFHAHTELVGRRKAWSRVVDPALRADIRRRIQHILEVVLAATQSFAARLIGAKLLVASRVNCRLDTKTPPPNFTLSVPTPSQDFVSFPATGLDMGKYLTGWPAAGPTPPSSGTQPPPPNTGAATATASGEPSGDVPAPSLPYDLLAVVNHSGGMAQGHYTAYVKEIGRWFRFDDTWVHEVDEKEVLASEAYILFYFQRGADAAWRPPPAEAPSPAATGKRRL